jgi:membrane protease YdiL (CAAX protease family)
VPAVPEKTPAYSEAALLVAISFGWFIMLSMFAVMQGFPASGTFSDASLMAMVLIELVLGTMALTFLRFRGYRLRDLLPAPSWHGCLEGVLLGAVAVVAGMVATQLVPFNHDAVQPIDEIMSRASPSLGMVIVLSMLNGLYEETFLLGYLARGFASLGTSFALGLSVLVRLLYHLYQGPAGAVSVVVFGVIPGVVYLRTRRLWPAVVAHALADLLALSSIVA